jgi:hypothetical protein
MVPSLSAVLNRMQGIKKNAPADRSAGAAWNPDGVGGQFRDLANSSLFIALKIFHSSLW